MTSEWQVFRLGEVTNCSSGSTPSKQNSKYWGGDVPWVTAKDMKTFYLCDSEDGITEDALSDGAKIAPKGAVLVLTRGMTLLNDVPICLLKIDSSFNQDVKAIQSSDPVLAGEYLPYLLLGHKSELLSLVDLAGHGTGRLATDLLLALEISMPSPREQREIAHILGTLDDKIELNRKTNETLEAMAKALFQSCFVDFDPVRAKAEGRPTGLPDEISDLFPDSFEESELGEIPRGWHIGCLSDCCEITMGQSPPGDTYNEKGDGLPFYQGKTDFGFRFPGRRIYCTSPSRTASEGATLISVRAPVGSANIAKELCAIGRGIAALKSRQDAKSFVYYLIGTLQNIFESYNSEGTVFGAINGKDLASIMVTVPDAKVISAFNVKCSSMDELIKKNTEEAENLASIRDAILPKLISGELRIPEAEKLVSDLG